MTMCTLVEHTFLLKTKNIYTYMNKYVYGEDVCGKYIFANFPTASRC